MHNIGMRNIKAKTCFSFLIGITFISSCQQISASSSETSSSSVSSDVQPYCTVKFDKVIDVETNAISDQVVANGELARKPVVAVSGDSNVTIAGWYEDSSYSASSEWDFDLDKVTHDMTLYAKWDEIYSVRYFLPNDLETPVYQAKVKKGLKTYECDDKVPGYKIDGYYTDSSFNNAYDFDATVTKNLDIYIKTDMVLYFSSSVITSNFSAHAATGEGSTVGSITKGDGYARIDFGLSYPVEGAPHGDPYVSFEGQYINIEETQDVTFRIKNLGNANQLAFYWTGVDKNGNAVGAENYSETNVAYYTFPASEKNMSESGEWKDITFHLGQSSSTWPRIQKIGRFRLQSNATCRQGDTPNVFLVKEIFGTHDDKYDTRNPIVTFKSATETYSSIHVKKGSSITSDFIADAVFGFKVEGYYLDEGFTQKATFPMMVTTDTTIYVKLEKALYFHGKDFTKFEVEECTPKADAAFPASKGNITYDETTDSAKVNFGISTIADPRIVASGLNIPIAGINKLRMRIKNIGKASQMGVYFAGNTASGQFTDFGPISAWYPLGSDKQSMSEFVEIEFDLSDSNLNSLKTLTKIRIEAAYVSKDETDDSNIIYFDTVEGVQ